MNNKLKNIPISLISTVAILLLLIIFINNVQITLGRYMSSVDGKAVFLFNAKQSLELNYGEWEEAEGRQTLLININNTDNVNRSAQSGAVRIRLYMPQIDVLPSVRISINSVEYASNISTVPVGTAIYKLYGEGNICRFYGDAGEEVCFDFPSSSTDSLTATLILIADTPVDTTGIKIMAEPINTKGNGGN